MVDAPIHPSIWQIPSSIHSSEVFRPANVNRPPNGLGRPFYIRVRHVAVLGKESHRLNTDETRIFDMDDSSLRQPMRVIIRLA